ncbi:hypothetical protein ABFS82_13G193000 [Erythranthe guttata]|nr:PREDICTED: phosphoglycerate mutase-like protein AT74 [Erythranthe guttata]|eukprot:XP_012829706.1 PREDICTED: phosphoglycerate mutase-like protein AT74 [Erythranthe guttata]
MAESSSSKEQRWLPKRIILVRHGETMENKDGVLPDHSIQLTKKGMDQAKEAGVLIKGLLDENCNWKVYIYVSPYKSTRSTLREMGRAFPESKIAGVREECRLREQDLGNFHDTHKIKQLNEMRNKFGRFFYRFPDGESGADVYDRVSNFLESLWRDIEMKRCIPNNNNNDGGSGELNLVIVSHGLAIRIFMMRWFRWSVDQFERLKNPDNCEFIVMQLGSGGEYSLSINHNDHKLTEWGLSHEMIADQRLRASGSSDALKQEDHHCLWYDAFFSHSEQQDQDQDEDHKTTK